MNHAPIPQRAAFWLAALLALITPLHPTKAAPTTAPAARIFPETVLLDGAEARQQLLAFKTEASSNTPAGEIAKAQFVVEDRKSVV